MSLIKINKYHFWVFLCFFCLFRGFSFGQETKDKTQLGKGEYSIEMFPLETVDVETINSNQSNGNAEAEKKLLLKAIKYPVVDYKKHPEIRDFNDVEQLLKKGTSFDSYKAEWLFLIEVDKQKQTKSLKAMLPVKESNQVDVPWQKRTKMVWNPKNRKTYVILYHQRTMVHYWVHSISIYEIDDETRIRSFPFTYTKDDFPNLTEKIKQYKYVEYVSSRHLDVKKVTGINLEMEDDAILISGSRAKESLPKIHFRFYPEERKLYRAYPKQQKKQEKVDEDFGKHFDKRKKEMEESEGGYYDPKKEEKEDQGHR